LRLGDGAERWEEAQRAIQAMSATEQADPTWQYWRARAQLALARSGEAGEAQRAPARQTLGQLAGQWHFYGQLAAEDLGRPQALPPRPAPPTPAERDTARENPGFQRGLAMVAAGLRPEGVREWNFHLLGLSDRDILAAAQMACEREVWDRCINSAERARGEVDMALRFPTPLLAEVSAQAQAIGLEPAFVYGLVRQESRFIVDAKSVVGAAGLMQVMPATAKWTAKKIGLTDFKPTQITERDTNLRIGTAYLKLVLDSLDGVQPLAAAAYNAGPSRARRWREGPPLEPAIWAENIPFNETRDYVKKVSSNTVYYQALLSGKPAALKPRLGAVIGPRDTAAPPADPDLP
jgi:soluble lytic murein transglycosylase